jgi:1-acyl-sn-glycerol-3-phosphate acyltransferase
MTLDSLSVGRGCRARATLLSLYVWISFGIVVLVWLCLVGISRLLDRSPIRYRTGYVLRKLGNVAVYINPAWRLHVSGENVVNSRKPYVVVCNHQSLADIPFISNLPWEMKWMAKAELFRIPIVGWMMRWSGDIAVDRGNAKSGARALKKAKAALAQECSVMVFPEGTRTHDGRVRAFSDGAFHLAIRAKVPILPLAIEGSRECIPKHSWRFGKPSDVLLKILPPINTSGFSLQDVGLLRDSARAAIMTQIAAWRNVPVEAVDGGGVS